MVSLALIPSLSRPDFRDINFPENGLCAHQPQDYCQLMRHQIDTEIPSKIQHMQYKTILVCEYNKWFLVVECGSGLWIISVYGTPFPTRTADQDNSYLREAAIVRMQVPGLSSRCLSLGKESGQDNSQGQASEYFECTRKHYEHGYNITTMFQNIYAHDVSHKR